uniref:Uncharacterized protein n=1 Tax=Timema shepardi TaxID=629360 RepID=A0A7R9AX49_TIMSH|nr:unnamed protein product [Timema shepardi]
MREVNPHLRERRMENHAQCTRPGLYHDLPIFSSLVRNKSSALDHAATEAAPPRVTPSASQAIYLSNYSSPMASLVLADSFEKLPDQIIYLYAEPYDLQKHKSAVSSQSAPKKPRGYCSSPSVHPLTVARSYKIGTGTIHWVLAACRHSSGYDGELREETSSDPFSSGRSERTHSGTKNTLLTNHCYVTIGISTFRVLGLCA